LNVKQGKGVRGMGLVWKDRISPSKRDRGESTGGEEGG